MAKLVAFKTSNGYAPKQGPKVVPINLAFSVSTLVVNVDLLIENTDGDIDFVQSIYIDNKDNAAPLEVLIPITGQRITCPSAAQGTFPIYGVDQFQATFTCIGENSAKVHLCNFPQPYSVWTTV